MNKDKPYRQRVEVLIHRNNKVLVTVNHYEGGVWHGLPGGGVDEGEGLVTSVSRECLEEVGIKIKNIRHSGKIGIKEGYKSAHADREAKYRGSETHLYEADYDGIDNRILGVDGDAVKYEWMTPKQAYDLFHRHITKNGGGSGTHAVERLSELM